MTIHDSANLHAKENAKEYSCANPSEKTQEFEQKDKTNDCNKSFGEIQQRDDYIDLTKETDEVSAINPAKTIEMTDSKDNVQNDNNKITENIPNTSIENNQRRTEPTDGVINSAREKETTSCDEHNHISVNTEIKSSTEASDKKNEGSENSKIKIAIQILIRFKSYTSDLYQVFECFSARNT